MWRMYGSCTPKKKMNVAKVQSDAMSCIVPTATEIRTRYTHANGSEGVHIAAFDRSGHLASW